MAVPAIKQRQLVHCHVTHPEPWYCALVRVGSPVSPEPSQGLGSRLSSVGDELKYEKEESLWNSCLLAAHSEFLGLSEVY